MKVILFSHGVSIKAGNKLIDWIGNKPNQIRALYITTPINPRPKRPDWCQETQDQLEKIIPNIKEFDVEKFHRKNFDFKKFFEYQDLIFVSGGNTYYLSYWMKKVGAEKPLRELVLENKLIYAGESAGAVYLLENFDQYKAVDHPEKAPKEIPTGLGLINFAPLPHWNDKRFRKDFEVIENDCRKRGIKTYRLKDGEAIFIENDTITKLI